MQEANVSDSTNLLTWRKGGLTKEVAAVLFHVVRLYEEYKRPIRLDEIVTTLTDDGSPFKSEMKPGSVRTIAAQLKKRRWPTESKPYLTGIKDCYEPVKDVFVTDRDTAKLVLGIHAAPSSRIRESSVRQIKDIHHWEKDDFVPEDSLQLLVDHQYCVLDRQFVATTGTGGGRFAKEREYLELLAGPSEELERRPNHVKERIPDRLEADHVEIIMIAWKKRWEAGEDDHDVKKDRISVSYQELAQALKSKNRVALLERLMIVVGEIDRYQKQYGWELLEIRPNEIEIVQNKAITYPQTAHFVLFIYDHPRTSEAFKQAKRKYPKTFRKSLEWTTFPEIGYLKKHPVSTVQYAVTPRVRAEELYLRAVTQYYDPGMEEQKHKKTEKKQPNRRMR